MLSAKMACMIGMPIAHWDRYGVCFSSSQFDQHSTLLLTFDINMTYWDPFVWQFFPHNLNLMEILFCSH